MGYNAYIKTKSVGGCFVIGEPGRCEYQNTQNRHLLLYRSVKAHSEDVEKTIEKGTKCANTM